MAMTDTGQAPLRAQMLVHFTRKRRMAFLVPGAILAYLVYIFFAFDIPGLAARARMDNAAILLSDFWVHKTHVTRDNRTGALSISIDGEARATYPPGKMPDWVTVKDGVTTIDLPGGHSVVYRADGGAIYNDPGYGMIEVRPQGGALAVTLPPGDAPQGISISDNRVSVTTDQGRFFQNRTHRIVINAAAAE